ncbi:MAG: MerC domain-containing protein [Planctomycetes bacterium]|nr:MerC domain-containing protein [Planctomycetota bacterium]
MLSSLGLSFLLNDNYLLAAVGLLIGITLLSFLFRARQRRGYGPFWLGLAASLVMLGGKFLFISGVILYAGAAVLIIASIWNIMPKRIIRQPENLPAVEGDCCRITLNNTPEERK